MILSFCQIQMTHINGIQQGTSVADFLHFPQTYSDGVFYLNVNVLKLTVQWSNICHDTRFVARKHLSVEYINHLIYKDDTYSAPPPLLLNLTLLKMLIHEMSYQP